MQFTSALLLAPLAAALPTLTSTNPAHNSNGTAAAPDASTYENVDISDLYITETVSNTTTQVTGIARIDLVLNGNTTCSAETPGTAGEVFGCGDSAYRFGLVNGTSTQFGLRVYKQTAPFVGFYGSGDVETYCRAGGNGLQICGQVAPTTIVIS